MYHWRFETHIIFKILTCFLLLKSTHLIYLKIQHQKNRFNYILFEDSWKHMWNKLLKLALSSNNSIQNMEAMVQTWKNIVLRKDLHLGPTNSFNCGCTHKVFTIITHTSWSINVVFWGFKGGLFVDITNGV
jgi:hypothetical protein